MTEQIEKTIGFGGTQRLGEQIPSASMADQQTDWHMVVCDLHVLQGSTGHDEIRCLIIGTMVFPQA